MKKVVVLGSTGSIGSSTLQVIRHLTGEFQLYGIAGFKNINRLVRQAQAFNPRYVTVVEDRLYKELKRQLPDCRVGRGISGMLEMVEDPRTSTVVIALRGVVGLKPTLAALKKGKRVCLATKEILVSYGEILKEYLASSRPSIIPVDSEHSAIHQCIYGRDYETVKNLYLTASGGPFFGRNIKNVLIEDVLKHPTWKMGKKITVDSATLMNKGLEVIEASRLFGFDHKAIKVLIHPQSIIHSMVEFIDHSIIGQLSVPDMRLPIQYALTFPRRIKTLTKPCNLARLGRLDFFAPDLKRFPCLAFAYEALKIGGTMPAVLNAANEVCVNLFLEGKIKFSRIAEILARVVARHRTVKSPELGDIVEAERWSAQFVMAAI